MAPEHVPALATFLAVSSATLLIYLALGKPAGRPRTRGGDLADPEHDPIPGPALLKAPMTRPVRAAPAVQEVGGGGPGLGVPIALVAAVLLIGGLWQVARLAVRRQFELVVGKIASDTRLGINSDRGHPKVPNFRVGTFSGGPLPPNGFEGIRVPAGFGGVAAPAPVHRESFQMR